MKGNVTIKDLNVATLLGAIYQRLNLLAQDIGVMRLVTLDKSASTLSKRTFKSLRGTWTGVDISEEDIEEARISLPSDL